MDLSSIKVASLARALLARVRREAAEEGVGEDETRALGCRDRNSANTRFATEAHVDTIVRYSGEPKKHESGMHENK